MNIFEKIENTQDKARINRERDPDLLGQEYWIGFVAGLGFAKQLLEELE